MAIGRRAARQQQCGRGGIMLGQRKIVVFATFFFWLSARPSLPGLLMAIAQADDERHEIGRRWLLLNRTYHASAGQSLRTYRETLPCPDERTHGVLTVTMLNEHGQLFHDAVSVSFNSGFEQVLKWVALVPFVATVATVAFFASYDARETLLGI